MACNMPPICWAKQLPAVATASPGPMRICAAMAGFTASGATPATARLQKALSGRDL